MPASKGQSNQKCISLPMCAHMIIKSCNVAIKILGRKSRRKQGSIPVQWRREGGGDTHQTFLQYQRISNTTNGGIWHWLGEEDEYDKSVYVVLDPYMHGGVGTPELDQRSWLSHGTNAYHAWHCLSQSKVTKHTSSWCPQQS